MYERLLSRRYYASSCGLYEAYFETQEFKELYENMKELIVLKRKTIPHELFSVLIKERAETGRIYILNVDCNT